MPQLIADRRDIDFVLFEQLDAHKLCRQEIYGEFIAPPVIRWA